MSRMTRWAGVLGCALLGATAIGCGELVDDGGAEDLEGAGEAVRISGRFEITLPAGDVWSGARDLNSNVPGVQVRVEVHQIFTPGSPWTNHGNELRTQYRVITTGEENVRGVPRIVATSSMGGFRAVNGAFVLDNALYLVGNATGGRTSRGATRNEKPVVIGIAFNGRAAADSLATAARIEDIHAFTFPAGSGPVVFDTPAFAQRWTDANNENFACYNIDSASGQFLTGTSPIDFRSVAGGFVLNGHLFALGEATGGSAATAGVPGGYHAVAPRRALAHYGTGAAGTRVDFNVTVTNLPSP